MIAMVRNLPSVVISLSVHAGVILLLMLVPVYVPELMPELMLESVRTDEKPQEELTRELDLQTTAATSLNVIAGGTPSTSVGAANQPAAAPVNVQKANVMREVDVRPAVSDVYLPSDELISMELGEGEITGEVGSMVEGYGNAMGIVTQELLRMMRIQKVTVIWLFDESESLVDDRQEIKENYLRVYDELGIAANQDEDLRKGSELLLTVVASYGSTVHQLTPRPTADATQIRNAIDLIPVDESGQENMCQSIAAVINEYKQQAIRGKRKLAVIVVSDESGDDGGAVEEAIVAARQAKAPVYFMGRESTFGYPYAHHRWIHKESGEHFWIQIRRGPETAFPECLQWNGLHARWDVQVAGFGPYEQVRIARETGGIYFVLPGEEEALTGDGANDKRKYDFLAMREYQPTLTSRPEYVRERAASKFRETLWAVISQLNPTNNDILFQSHDPELNIQHEHYPLLPDAFRQTAQVQIDRAARAMILTNRAIAMLEDVKSLRASEASQRWRAGYDLALSQLYVFRLRLYQFLLTIDKHANGMPKLENPMSNEWNIWWSPTKLEPDEQQYKRLQAAFALKMSRDEYLAMVVEEENRSIERLQQVIKDHPGTPWAYRAQRELNDGFGFRVADRLWDPKGVRSTIKVPNF
ncbi:MAG: VWA domain-containing protein [Planctomyces sp.]|nr:VWA domain-containing protein [Planctomyces sp.]